MCETTDPSFNDLHTHTHTAQIEYVCVSICLDVNALTLRLFDKASQLGNKIYELYPIQQSHFPLDSNHGNFQ